MLAANGTTSPGAGWLTSPPARRGGIAIIPPIVSVVSVVPAGLDPLAAGLVGLVAFLAATLSGITGFGGAILLLPVQV